MRVRGRVVVVTGASSGFGRATARLLARRGAEVWAVARSEPALRSLADQNAGIRPFPADLTHGPDRARLAAAVPHADVLVNNAGVGWFGLTEDMDADTLGRLVELNLVAVADLCRRLVPGMLARGRGHIVNVASVAGWVAVPPLTAYAATKAAVLAFSDGLRRELLGRGVTVTVLAPGPLPTAFYATAAGDAGAEPLASSAVDPQVGPASGLVASAVLRSTWLRHVPGYQTMAVPRVVGLARLGAVPGISRLVDLGGVAGRVAGSALRRSE